MLAILFRRFYPVLAPEFKSADYADYTDFLEC
jgi:hypothetical protein